MKNKLLILFLVMNIGSIYSQHLEIDLNGGISNPLGDFSQDTAFATRGLALGGEVNYLWKNFGFGIDAGNFTNETQSSLNDFQNGLPFSTQLDLTNDTWKTRFASLGPILQVGNEKIKFQLSPKMGLAQIQLPDYSIDYFSTQLNQNINLLSQTNEEQQINNILTNLGAKLKFNLSPSFGLHLKANYLTTRFFNKEKLSYTIKELTDVDGDGFFTEEEIIESPNFIKEICSPLEVLNTSVGLTFQFGKNKEKKQKSPTYNPASIDKKEREKKAATCLNVQLISPIYEEFNPKFDKAPTFAWSINSNEKVNVLFELFTLGQGSGGEEVKRTKVFETKTTNRNHPWPKNVPWPKELRQKDPSQYEWQITILPKAPQQVCQGVGLAQFSLIPGEVDVDILARTIVCREPDAYDLSGQVCFDVSETWEVTNGLATPIQFSSFTLSQGIFTSPTPAPATVFTPVAANSTQTFSYNYQTCTSVSTTQSRARLAYVEPSDPSSEAAASKLDSLPLCLCDICEEWEISLVNQQTIPWMHNTAQQDYIYIQDRLTAIPPAGHTIVQVNAEIIDFRHYGSNSEDCKTCNKENTQFGTFIPYRNASNQDITNVIAPANFGNGGKAKYTRYSGAPSGSTVTLGAPSSRESIWKTTSAAGTILNNRQVDLSIGVPRFSELVDCCSDEIEICIRYTFTALNEFEECIKCSEVLCYRITRDASTIVPKSEPQPQF